MKEDGLDHYNENSSKTIQQHLANERTYLAWVRTSIAIIGLGFLATGIVFQTDLPGHASKVVASICGAGSVIMGSSMLTLATKDYFTKRKGIDKGSFSSPSMLIWILSITLGVVSVLLVILVLLMVL